MLDGFANSSAEQTGYSDMEARVLISRLTLLPLALRFGGESKESYRTQLESLSSEAVNLALPSGENKGKPDFKNRARACAASASGWAVLGQGWFSGDAKVRSQEMITNALGYAEQVVPPVQVAGSDDAMVTQHQKELALVAVVGALAQSGQYERSFEIWHRIGLPENQGVAGELLAFRLGGAQRMEDATRLLRDTPEGEARTRAAVAFLYGLYQLPLEKWW